MHQGLEQSLAAHFAQMDEDKRSKRTSHRSETSQIRSVKGRGVFAASLTTFFFFQAEDGIRDLTVTGVQTCALPISVVAAARAASDPRLEPPAALLDLGRVRDPVAVPGCVERDRGVAEVPDEPPGEDRKSVV